MLDEVTQCKIAFKVVNHFKGSISPAQSMKGCRLFLSGVNYAELKEIPILNPFELTDGLSQPFQVDVLELDLKWLF
jgi:hypothetical protein